MLKNLHIFGLFTVTCGIVFFSLFGYSGSLLLLANTLGNMRYYHSGFVDIRAYNQTIIDIKADDYRGAFIVLDSITGAIDHVSKRDYSELYGDLLYHNGGATGMVLSVYQESLNYGKNERVQHKIDLLSGVYVDSGSGAFAGTGSIGSGVTQDIQNHIASGSMERDKEKGELEKIQAERSDSIDLNAGAVNSADLINSTLEVLNGGLPKKDW